MMELSSFSLTVNLCIFVSGTFAIWVAGTLLSTYADEIARRTGLGHVFVGLFLLAGVTSLPEIATSFSAAQQGESQLAVTNLLGSIAMQVAILAVGDLLYSRRALTYIVPDPALMLQGTLNIVLLTLVAIAMVFGDVGFWGAGVWTWGLFLAVLYSFFKLQEASNRQPWVANFSSNSGQEKETSVSNALKPIKGLPAKAVMCSLVILVAGFFVARTATSIASQTGISSSFMGMAFLAISTSLPELSTVFAALRQKLYAMAISDIFGTNILNVGLIFGIDIIAKQSPVLNHLGSFSVVAALLGALLTGLFLMGLAERRDRTFLRMGMDSLLVLLFYGAGLALLFNL